MDDLVKLIGEAAVAIGVESVRIWPQIVMITFIKNLVWVILEIVLLACGIIFTPLFIRHAAHKAEAATDSDAAGGWGFAKWVVPLIVLGLLVIMIASSVPDHLAGVIAPEAQTVLDIIRGIKR